MIEKHGEQEFMFENDHLVAPQGGDRLTSVPIETDKTASIPSIYINPLYNDPNFQDHTVQVTVFLASGARLEVSPSGIDAVRGLEYEYSDRLLEHFGNKKWREAAMVAEQEGITIRSAAFFEKILQLMYDDADLELQHILTGINSSSLYSFRHFGFRRGTDR